MLEILKKTYGGVPVWVWSLIFVGIVFWYIKRRQAANASKQNNLADVAGQTMADAQPMMTQSDIFINITNPVDTDPSQTPSPSPNPTPAPSPAPQPSPPPRKKTMSYVVKKGDTLWSIAQRYLGSGNKYGAIYAANKGTIENTAHKHGMSSSQGGHWIFPGETLVIPT